MNNPPNKKGKYKQGYFIPKHPNKYIGDVNDIIYRSSWEKRFMIHCDLNSNVISWGSESFPIPYYNNVKGRMARYYPDFCIKVKQKRALLEQNH